GRTGLISRTRRCCRAPTPGRAAGPCRRAWRRWTSSGKPRRRETRLTRGRGCALPRPGTPNKRRRRRTAVNPLGGSESVAAGRPRDSHRGWWQMAAMNHSVAPLLEALTDYHARDRYGFTPPGHRQGRGADPRTIAAIGRDAFRSDLLATAGLDDRKSSHGYLSQAEQLMADAVGTEQAFFSTCGSSLPVKAAMLAVAGGRGDLLLSRDAHKSVVAGLVFGGVRPQWIRPQYDERLHVAHPPSPRQVEEAWQEHPDAVGALIVSPAPHGTCADITAIADICHRRGKPLIVDEAWGAHLPFHQDLPTWAMDAGADVCVVSVHKMGAAPLVVLGVAGDKAAEGQAYRGAPVRPDFSAVSAACQPGFLPSRQCPARPPGLAPQGKDWTHAPLQEAGRGARHGGAGRR